MHGPCAFALRTDICISSSVDGITEAQLAGLAENVVGLTLPTGGTGCGGLARRLRSYGILRGVAGFLQFLFCLGVLSVFKGFRAALLENGGDGLPAPISITG